MDIIPSGNWVQDLTTYRERLERRCWSRGRCDALICGGLTAAKKYLAMSESFGEISQCYGISILVFSVPGILHLRCCTW